MDQFLPVTRRHKTVCPFYIFIICGQGIKMTFANNRVNYYFYYGGGEQIERLREVEIEKEREREEGVC